MKRTLFTIGTVLVCAAFAAERCGGHDHGPEHAHGHGHAEGEGSGVEVSEAAAKAMGLRTVRAERRRMRSTVPLLGRIELAPDARAVAASPVAGRVSIKVRPLAHVEVGEVLFTVDAPDLRAKAAEIEILGRRLRVYHELNRASAELEAQLALRRAEREALLSGAEERDGVVSVRAATAGRVDALPAVDGSWVSVGTSVVELTRPDRIRFRAMAASSEAARLEDGMKAVCGNAVGKVVLGTGDAAGLTPVYVVFDGGVAARPGEARRVDCVTDEGEAPVTAVPTASIVRVGLEPTVFVRDERDRDRFIAVKAETGRVNGGWTEVKGLPDDDDLEVVKEGVYELGIAVSAKSGAAPAGHFHADGTFHEDKDD